MAVLSRIANIINESNIDWITIATKFSFDHAAIEQIKNSENSTKQFVECLTTRIWDDIFQHFGIISNVTNKFAPGILQLLSVLTEKKETNGKHEIEVKFEEQHVDVIHEISMLVADWKAFARVLGFSESYINDFEKFIEPSLSGDIFKRNSQRNKYLMNEALKTLKQQSVKTNQTSWTFWRRFLVQFYNGKEVIKEIERYFPTLLAEITTNQVHQTMSPNMTYIGHPLQHESFQINKNNAEIPVNVGSSSFQMIDIQQHSDWLETQERYMDVFNLFKDKVVFNFHDLEEYCPILNTLEQFINDTGGNGFAAKGYHVVEHLKIFDQRLFLNDETYDNYFCYLGKEGIAINFTKCHEEPGHALHYSSQNFQIMNALHKELQSKDIIQVNVLVHNKEKGVRFCAGCIEKHFYIREDVLIDIEKFNDWFNEIYKSVCNLKQKTHLVQKSYMDIVFKNLKKDMITYEALYKTDSFPTFSNLPEDQMNEMPNIIFLSSVQFTILHTDYKHIILRGPYGSGKTIVLRKKLDQCIQSMKEKDILYYICHDQQSKFKHQMKFNKGDNKHNYILVCHSKDLPFYGHKPTLSMILKHILQYWKNKTVHIFIDEFCGSYISEKEILALNEVLPEFQNSHIVIALQSMEEKALENISHDVDLGYQYDILEKNTSFVVYNLDYSLRCSAEINEFVKVTSEFIEQREFTDLSIENFFDDEKYLFVDKEYGQEIYFGNFQGAFIPTIIMKPFYNTPSKCGHSSCNGPVSIYVYNKFPSSVKTVMNFFKSRNIVLPPIVPIYISTVEFILGNSTNEKFVICTYDEELYNAIYFYFDIHPFHSWTSEIKTFMEPNSQCKILLTDYASIRGYEFHNFIFLLRMGTKYLKYRMIECFTRSISKLYIVIDNINISDKYSSENQLIEIWKNLSCVEYFDCKYDSSKDTLQILQDGIVNYSKDHLNVMFVGYVDKFPWSKSIAVEGEESRYRIIDDLYNTICYLFENDDVGLVREFFKINEINVLSLRNENNGNLLHVSSLMNAVNIADFLISEFQFDVGSCDSDQQTPLHYAAKYGHTEVMKLLINNKADIHAADTYGRTPLDYARGWNICEVDKLIEDLLSNK